MSASNQQFSLRWNNYVRHITYAFDSLRSHEDLVDVTLCCEGRKIRAHKILLSACSTYFKDVFKENPCQHPVIVFKNVKYDDLLAIIQFMYQGEVNVQQDSLPSFLNTAEMLSVQGLTDTDSLDGHNKDDTEISTKSLLTQKILLPSKTVENKQPTYTLTTEQLDVGVSLGTAKIQSITMSTGSESIPCAKNKSAIDDEDENISYIEGEELDRTHMEIPDETTTHYLKMEIPEYIDVVENPSNEDIQLNESLKASSGSNKDEDEYKVIDSTDSDMEIIYSNSNRDSAMLPGEIGRMLTAHQQQTSEQTSINKHTTNTVQDIPSSKWSQCQFCKLVITTVNLWRHIRTQHTAQPPRQCELCNKKFKNKYSLREHVRIAHEQKVGPKI